MGGFSASAERLVAPGRAGCATSAGLSQSGGHTAAKGGALGPRHLLRHSRPGPSCPCCPVVSRLSDPLPFRRTCVATPSPWAASGQSPHLGLLAPITSARPPPHRVTYSDTGGTCPPTGRSGSASPLRPGSRPRGQPGLRLPHPHLQTLSQPLRASPTWMSWARGVASRLRVQESFRKKCSPASPKPALLVHSRSCCRRAQAWTPRGQ